MEPKELAKLALELIQDNRKEETLSLIIDPFTEEKEKLQALINVQIQMKEIGGGFPPVGKQIRTISEIINFTEVATKYSLEKGNQLVTGILYHNLASFCFPNMDEGVDEKLINTGYEAAAKDYELRVKIGEKNPILWAKWLLGVSEFIKGDITQAVKTLRKTSELAMEEPLNHVIDAWCRMMIVKFQLKTDSIKKKKAKKQLLKIETTLKQEKDDYGLETLKNINKQYFL